MKTFISHYAWAVIALLPVGTDAANIDQSDLADKLSRYCDFSAKALYEVLLPTSQYPVIYDIKLNSTANADSLAAADYLIEWSLEKDGNRSEGFSAYFPGNHYRYRDQRLQEYHAEWDSNPFMPMGDVSRGVQNQAQFCELLPQYIGNKLSEMAKDSTYKSVIHPDTLIAGRRVIAVDGVRSFQGIEALIYTYVFDRQSLRPLKIEFDSNPGQISEQTITATFSYPEGQETIIPTDEEALMVLYPDIFEKFRESSFRLENLPGRRLPEFSVPTTTGERYTHHKDDTFASPTVLVLLDTDVATTAETVNAVRNAVDALPLRADLIFAFINNSIDAIEQVVPAVRPGEHLLMSARGLARDCGATTTPVTIIVKPSGEVADLMIGFNKNLSDFVIQKTAMAAR